MEAVQGREEDTVSEKLVVEMRNIVKIFPGAKVLDNAYLTVRPGEIMGLIGENGAGKSTLLKILTGVYHYTSGQIRYDGENVFFASPNASLEAGIAMMHQELNIFTNLTVAENIFCDRTEYRSKAGFIQKKRIRRDARKILDELGAQSLDILRLGETLTAHEQQIVEIAKAISRHSKVIIMDEPTSSLPEGEVQILFDLIRKLREKGIAIIYVTHKMAEIEQLCDRVTVMRDGKTVGVVEMRESTVSQLVDMMIGRALSDYYPHSDRIPGKTVVELEDVSGPGFSHVNLSAREGEIVGIYGLMGSGADELVETIFALRRPLSGTMRYRGEKKTYASNGAAMRHGVAYIPADRKTSGIVKDVSIKNNILLASGYKFARRGLIDMKRAVRVCREYVHKLNVKCEGLNQKIGLLSGGNQQKVIIAKWLSIEPSLLIMNDPTRGIDVGAKAEIYFLIDKIAREGACVLLVSSEAPEVLGMADRVYTMYRGKINAEIQRGTDRFTQEVLLSCASGRAL